MNNTTSVRGYIWDNLFYIVMGFVWYKNILMKCLNGMSYDQSRTILIVMIGIMSAIGIIINIRKNRNRMTYLQTWRFLLGSIQHLLTYL